MKQKIVFFGSGWYTIPVIAKLKDHGLDLVITTERKPASIFLKYCKDNNIQTLSITHSKELTEKTPLIKNYSVAVLASFGSIIPRNIIDLFPYGIINIHPSLLPKYKGPSPIQYALLNGETVTGVTIIKLDNEVDHGPILAQKPYNLIGHETTPDMLSILFEIGAEMVEELIVKFENNEAITETPQDHRQESWSYKIEKKDGEIDLSSIPLEIGNWKLEIARKERAYYPWPGVWFVCPPELVSGSQQLSNKIIKLLPEGCIQVEGKKPMNYNDFLNGYGDEGKTILEKLMLI